MTKIRFSDHQEGESENSEANSSAKGGQPVVSMDALKELLQSLGVNNQQDDSNQQPRQQTVKQKPHEIIGLDEDSASALKESFGEQQAELLVKLLAGLQTSNQTNDVALLTEIEKLNTGIQEKLDEQGKSLKDIRSNSVNSSYAALGLDEVFNDNNKEDLAEMLDLLSERTGGLFDAKEDFNKRADAGDIEYLKKTKDAFVDYLGHKYKDHASVQGKNTVSVSRSQLDEANKLESEIDTLRQEREQYLTGVNKDPIKALEIGDKLLQKVEALESQQTETSNVE